VSAWRLAGDFINDEPQSQDTDIWAMDHQLLAITPISIDLTDYGSL
jgi:5'-nucleotidase